MPKLDCDVVIVGAGPAGAMAASLLAQRGYHVEVLEREIFPRFSVGESLLPQSMAFLQEAGMLQAVIEAGFQHKNGACFVRGEARQAYDFRDKFTPGFGTTYQVQRAQFDEILATCAKAAGAQVRFGITVTNVTCDASAPTVEGRDATGNTFSWRARHVLDASGFGRVLPRLLQLETLSGFPPRAAMFTHVQDNIGPRRIDRNKITVAVHPQQHDVWYWLIPFACGRASLGVVGPLDVLPRTQEPNAAALQAWVRQEPHLADILGRAEWDTPVRHINSYSANVASLTGAGYTLLGNAGEFLDPVFSSGVTIALQSARLAVACLVKQLDGHPVDWQAEFEQPLRRGIDTFRCFVDMWYSGELQRIIFSKHQPRGIRQMVASILAGYAWDENNPFVARTRQRMAALHALCVTQG